MNRNDAYVVIDGVTKRFGSVTAVNQAKIGVKTGEFFSLLGPSGCGKTTLLRMLAGFEFPTEGEIYIDGQPISDTPAHKRPTNMVFQSYAIFPHLNVRQNVGYGLRKLPLDKAEKQKRVDAALEMVKLEGLGERKGNQLSGGQRQRVALARALIMRPKVLLLDEPLSALDKKLRGEMQLELRALQQDVGITFIFVTHDQEEALSMSDRIAVMAMGDVLQIASPKELYERPATKEVAGFIGQINFLEAQVMGQENGHAVVDTNGLGRMMVPSPPEFAVDGARVTIAIRPEKLYVDKDKPNDMDGSAKGDLQAAAYLGDRSHYHVHVEGRDKPLAVAAQNYERRVEETLPLHGDVWVSWKNDTLILLPPDS